MRDRLLRARHQATGEASDSFRWSRDSRQSLLGPGNARHGIIRICDNVGGWMPYNLLVGLRGVQFFHITLAPFDGVLAAPVIRSLPVSEVNRSPPQTRGTPVPVRKTQRIQEAARKLTAFGRYGLRIEPMVLLLRLLETDFRRIWTAHAGPG
jgi:hypothetical protein